MGETIMLIDDIQVRLIKEKDIYQLFDMAKLSLKEKSIENINDDILMVGVKNSLVKKYTNIDFGLFKLNTLIGFAFVELSHPLYLDSPVATLDTIFIIEEFRTEQNYHKLLDNIMLTLTKTGIKNIKTTDDWTLCNDCEILKTAIINISRPRTYYDLEI
jgi:hypothetical protein